MKRYFRMLCAAVLLVPSLLGAVTTHILEIEGARSFSDVRSALRQLIRPSDNIALIFRGSGASLLMDMPASDLSSLTVSGNGSLRLAEGTPPFTVQALHLDESCTSLTVDAVLLNGLFSGLQGLELKSGQTLTVEGGGSYNRDIVMAPGSVLRKTGGGTLSFPAANEYKGRLEVLQGELRISSSERERDYSGGLLVHPGAVFHDSAGDLTQTPPGDMHIYGTLQVDGVWHLPGAASAEEARLFLHAGCSVVGNAPFSFRNGGGALAFRQGRQTGEASPAFDALIADFDGTLWVDVEAGLSLAMPPPLTPNSGLRIKKTGPGRWYVRDGNGAPVHYDFTGDTDIEEGSLFVYSVGTHGFSGAENTVGSAFSVARGGRIGGTALLGRSGLSRGGWVAVRFASGGGVDWRGWDGGPREQLRFYDDGWTSLEEKGCYPSIEAGSDFTIVDYDKPTESVSVFSPEPLINFNGNAARENFAALNLTFVTDDATYRDSYRIESVHHLGGRYFQMTATPLSEQVLSAAAEVYAGDKTPVDVYSALKTSLPPNGDLTLYFRPYGPETDPGVFQFNHADGTTLPLGDLTVTGTPGVLDSDGRNNLLTYTRLTTAAPLTVTPDFLNRVANPAPAEFVLPDGYPTAVKARAGGETQINKAIAGSEGLRLEGTLTVNSRIGPLIATTLAPEAVLSLGAEGAFLGSVQTDAESTLVTVLPEASDRTQFGAPLVLAEGTALDASAADASAAGEGTPVLRAASRVVLPPTLRLRLPVQAAGDVRLLELLPSAALIGIPPESVTLTVTGGTAAHYTLKETAGVSAAGEPQRWLTAVSRQTVASAVCRTVTDAEQWYDDERSAWENTDNPADRYTIPPQDADVTLASGGPLAGLGLNVSPRVGQLTVTAVRPYTAGEAPYFSLVSASDDAAGGPRTLTADAVTLRSFCYFWPDTLRFADPLGGTLTVCGPAPEASEGPEASAADGAHTGILAGSARIPRLVFEDGAVLQVADGRVVQVSESLTLPTGPNAKWHVRVSSGSWGETKILSVLPTADVDGWNEDNVNIALWQANGEELGEEERKRCRIVQKTDGFYIRKELPPDTLLVGRTLDCAGPDAACFWNAPGQWEKLNVDGTPAVPAQTYDQPPTNAFVYITLDARRVPEGGNRTLTLNMNAEADGNRPGIASVRGIKIHALGGNPVLKTQFAAGNRVRVDSGESWLQCSQEVAGFTLEPNPDTLFLDRFHMDPFTGLVLHGDGYVFRPLADTHWNHGTVTFLRNMNPASGARDGSPEHPYEFFVPRRVGHLHIGPETTVRMVKNKSDGTETDNPKGPPQSVTHLTLTGAARDSSCLILTPGEIRLHTNTFPAENVTVRLGTGAETEAGTAVVFGPGAYLGPEAALDVRCDGYWESADGSADDGHTSTVTVGSLHGDSDIVLEAAESFEIRSLEAADFRGCFRLRRPSAADTPAVAAALPTTVRIRPSSAAQPADAAGGPPCQTFSGITEDAIPLEIDGSRLRLTGTWSGAVTVIRNSQNSAKGAPAGEIGGSGTVAAGGALTLEPGTVLDVTDGLLNVVGALSLPDPLTVRVPESVYNGTFDAPLQVLLYPCETDRILPNRVTVISDTAGPRSGAYRLRCTPSGPRGPGLCLERIVACGSLTESEMCWAPGGIGEEVVWLDADGVTRLPVPLPEGVDMELTVTDTHTRLDINNAGVARLGSLTVVGHAGEEPRLTFLDSVAGGDTLDIGTLRIGTNAPAHVVARKSIGSLGDITIAEGSSLTVQENPEQLGNLCDSPGTLIFQNPSQDGEPGNNPKFTYRDAGRVAHVRVMWDTDLSVTREPEGVTENGAVVYPEKAGPYPAADMVTEGRLQIDGTWDGPVSAVHSADSSPANLWGGGIAGTGVLRGTLTLGSDTLFYAPPQAFDQNGANVTTDLLDVRGAVTLPNGRLTVVLPKELGESSPETVRLFTPVPAGGYNGVNPATHVAGSANAADTVRYVLGDDGTHLLLRLNIDVYTRTFNGNDKFWEANFVLGIQAEQRWLKSGGGSAVEPTNGSVADATVSGAQTIELRTTEARTLESLTFRGDGSADCRAELKPHFNLRGDRNAILTAGKTTVALPLTLLKDKPSRNAEEQPVNIILGDVTVDNGGRLTLPDWSVLGGVDVVRNVSVRNGGCLVRGGCSEMVGSLQTESGAALDLTGGALGVKNLLHLPTDPEGDVLHLTIGGGNIPEGHILRFAEPLVRDRMILLPPVRIEDRNDIYALWEPKGLRLTADPAGYLLGALPKPNGKTRAEDPSLYTHPAAAAVYEVTGGILPEAVVAGTRGRTRLTDAAGTARVLDCFDDVAYWDRRTLTLYVDYEFGFSRFTYRDADTLTATCRVRNNQTGPGSFRQGVRLTVRCNGTPLPFVTLTEAQEAPVLDIPLESLPADALGPGRTARFTVEAEAPKAPAAQ